MQFVKAIVEESLELSLKGMTIHLKFNVTLNGPPVFLTDLQCS